MSSAARSRSQINLQWLIHLRWAAICGQLITVLVVRYSLGVRIPLAPLLVVIGVEFLTNAALLAFLRRTFSEATAQTPSFAASAPVELRLRSLQLAVTLLDTTLLAVLLALTGGTANPFCAFLGIHVVLAAVLLPLGQSLVAAGYVGCVLVVVQLVHAPLPGLDEGTDLRGWGTVVALALTSALSVYFVSRVTSALVRRSEQLEDERERRERRRHLEALGTLAAGAAHELGTPLSTIAIVAKDLERRLLRADAAGEDSDDARLIRDEVARCRRILGRMSTDAGGGMGEEMVATELEELGRLVLADLAGAPLVDLRVDRDGTSIDLPREGLATSVRAIVQNALDASEADGRVELAFRRIGTGDASALVISVVDRGAGMDADQLERALEPFYTTKDVGGGMGLGLYLAASLVESLGGRIEIASELRVGTEVRATIPLVRTGPGWSPRAFVG